MTENMIKEAKKEKRFQFEHYETMDEIVNFTVAVLEDKKVRNARNIQDLIEHPNVLVVTTPTPGQAANFTIPKGCHARCVILKEVWPY